MCNTSNLFKSILNPSKTTFTLFYLIRTKCGAMGSIPHPNHTHAPTPPPPKKEKKGTLLWVNFHYSLYTVSPKLGAFWGGQLNDFHSKSQSNQSNSVVWLLAIQRSKT